MPQDSKAKVRRVWLGLGYLEEKGANKLTRKQAQSFVALVAPWRKRPNMSRCEAKRLAGQIMSVLTPPQAQELRASPMNCESPKANTTEFIPSERKAESWASWLPPTTPSNPEYFEGRNRIFAEIQAIRAGENLFFPPESGIEMQKLPPHQRAEFTENYRLALKVLHQLERKTIF